MTQIHLVAPDGRTVTLEGEDGKSVMQLAVGAGVAGIVGECGGSAMCATCHVYVDEAWLSKLEPASEEEDRMLDEAYEVQENSRLSCQIPFSAALDGLKVTLAPEF